MHFIQRLQQAFGMQELVGPSQVVYLQNGGPLAAADRALAPGDLLEVARHEVQGLDAAGPQGPHAPNEAGGHQLPQGCHDGWVDASACANAPHADKCVGPKACECGGSKAGEHAGAVTAKE